MASRGDTSENYRAKFAGLVALAVVPLGVASALLFVRHRAIRDTESARSWVETPYTIERCQFVGGTSSESRRTLEIVYRYEVDGATYRGDRLDLLIGSMGDDNVLEERVHASFPPGASAVCYVNPRDPSQAVFDRDHAAKAARNLWLLAFPFLCIGVGFCYLLLSTFMRVTARDDAHAPLQTSPPRHIGLLRSAAVLAGPASAQVAWLFVVSFLFVFVMLDGPASYARLFTQVRQTQTTGQITDARVIDQHELSVPVYQYTFTYSVGDQAYTGQSFTRGQRFREGESVSITYDPANPATASIAGARPSSFTWWHSLIPLGVLLLLALGLGGMYVNSVRALRLCRHGHVARAHRGAGSGQTDPDLATMVSDFYSEANGHRYPARWYSPGKHGRPRRRLAGEPVLDVLYDPLAPHRNVVIEDALDEVLRGRLSTASCLTHCAPLILALAAIVLMFRG